MMTTRRKYVKSRKDFDGYDSRQEQIMHALYPNLEYHPRPVIQYVLATYWPPDFKLGVDSETGMPVFLELKEWFDGRDIAKYMAIVNSNSNMILLVICKTVAEGTMATLNQHPRIFCYATNTNLPMEWITRCGLT